MKKPRIYCPYCGEHVVQRSMEGRVRDFCINCAQVFYENPLPVASSIVVNACREVLLVKRGREPYQGMWCLPIGFAEADEEIEDAALRELREEAGIEGEILRLVDVDTVESSYYGNLAIVTYEVRAVRGEPRPGDDAIDARYFPLADLPPLAWSSNEKAIKLYLDFHRDTWAMMDSYRGLFPEIEAPDGISECPQGQEAFLSNVLVKMIEKDAEEITREWIRELESRVPALSGHGEFLARMNRDVLEAVRQGLRDRAGAWSSMAFRQAGRELRRMDAALPDVLNAMALSRKGIWMHVVRKKILSSLMEIYITLELNNRIIFIYDRIIYQISRGYME
ncbi:MAG: NUDIX domain-containing protein [Desulfomonilia bacterium]|jgi:8-oxo-dGTP diphosphatase